MNASKKIFYQKVSNRKIFNRMQSLQKKSVSNNENNYRNVIKTTDAEVCIDHLRF